MWGRGVSKTTGFCLLGVEFSDTCPDMSNTAQDNSSLTSMVMLTSLSTIGRVALMGLAIRMEGSHQRVMLSIVAPLQWIVGCPPLGKWVPLQVGLCCWPGT